jgi:MerR family regulatory protein
MSKGKRRASTPPVARLSAVEARPAVLPPEAMARRTQIAALREHRTRVLWKRLTPKQEQVIHDPSKVLGHRYPLTSGDVAKLTSLSERQIRYWADKGLIPIWRKGSRRMFEAAGLIVAFAIENSTKHEMHFYRSILEEPADSVGAKLSILTSLVAARLEDAEAGDAAAITTPLHELVSDSSS